MDLKEVGPKDVKCINWFRIRWSGRLFWTRQWTFSVLTSRGISDV